MENWIIYSISLQGEVKYIGKTCRYEKRKYAHLHRRGTYNSAIPLDIDLEEIEFNIVDSSCDREKAFQLENEYILKYNTLVPNGWNRMRSGLNRTNMTEEYLNEKMEYNKIYNKEHRREIQNKQNKRRHNNKEEYNKKQREYYQKNREKKIAYYREWRAKKKAEKSISA